MLTRTLLLALLSGTLQAWGAAPSVTPSQQVSPATERMAEAKRQLAADPKHIQAHTDLALAAIRRSRETADPAWLAEADVAIATGLHGAPGDFQLLKAQTALLLARQEWVKALAEARALNAKDPDDVTVYGYEAEADIALGKYDDADKAAQWMLNMRPNNVPGLLMGAELRVLYGDAPGALEFLGQVFAETPPGESEELAWVANRMAEIEIGTGQLAAAQKALSRAQELFPGSPRTQSTLAQLRLAEHRPADAIPLLEQELAGDPARHSSPAGTLLLLAEAQTLAGQPEAAVTFARFRESALQGIGKPAADTLYDNDTGNLIVYDAGLPGRPPVDAAESLRLATAAVAARQDVRTLDAYAWALYANSRYQEAETQIAKTLAVGFRSAQMDDHAGEIASKLGKTADAQKYFAQAVQAEPGSASAEEAGKRLGGAAQTALSSPNKALAPTLPLAEVPSPGLGAMGDAAAVHTPGVPSNPQASAPLVLKKDPGGVPTALLIPRPTSTERSIKKMQSLVAARPQDPTGYSGLGAAFFQRARETGDVEDYNLAEQALQKSLDLVSTDLTATAPLETMAEVCMGEHRFADALEYAQKSLALGSGDLSAFAIVGDAYADMGEYEKAGIAYGRLQPAGAAAAPQTAYAGQTRMAYLKFVGGDTGGAIAEMQTAISEGLESRLPRENLAWLYYELGEFSYQAGRIEPAADAYYTALTVYPGDYRALAGLGKVRATQGRLDEAITLYESAIAVVPMPIYIAELGDIYEKAGQAADAEKQYKLVEYIGRLGHINQVLHNRDLALFYADHDRKLDESLALAHKEFEVRSDIYTWDALAWASYKNGRYAEAAQAMAHATRLGTKDAMLLFHAGMIASKLGQQADATRELNEAITINPHFSVLYAGRAAQTLDALRKQAVVARNAGAAPPGK